MRRTLGRIALVVFAIGFVALTVFTVALAVWGQSVAVGGPDTWVQITVPWSVPAGSLQGSWQLIVTATGETAGYQSVIQCLDVPIDPANVSGVLPFSFNAASWPADTYDINVLLAEPSLTAVEMCPTTDQGWSNLVAPRSFPTFKIGANRPFACNDAGLGVCACQACIGALACDPALQCQKTVGGVCQTCVL